jgi:hypothetical protein
MLLVFVVVFLLIDCSTIPAPNPQGAAMPPKQQSAIEKPAKAAQSVMQEFAFPSKLPFR